MVSEGSDPIMAGPTTASYATSPSFSPSPSSALKPLQPTHINHLVSVKLDDQNYLLWRAQFLPLLRGYRPMGFVDGTHPCPPQTLENGTPNPAYTEWIEQDSILLGWLLSSLSDSVLAQVVDYETSREVWLSLIESLASKSEARQMQLHRDLQNIKKGDSSMKDYVLCAKALADQLATTGNKISLSNLKQFILQGLESSYDAIVTSLQTTMAHTSFEDFQSHLLSYEIRIQSQQDLLPTPPSLNVAAHSRSNQGQHAPSQPHRNQQQQQ
ncbi:hypothetical protein BVC80_1677g4 [Macleaya cordata]|uniref:Uncharacterized protein n=1 Tax=Macleaya cordata TaxID=56857 RepID=A0A200PPN2_MACCD|nr:hypothetical protein BVC80_1677g4 [Macleaya cordata]